MEYEILGENLPVVVCKLSHGEAMITQTGGMGWMNSNIEMSTNISGGIFSGMSRKISGESLFIATYACNKNNGIVAFPSSLPGSIVSFELEKGQVLIAQKTSFLCAEKGVEIKLHFKKRIGVGLFGGEGFIMQKIIGPGKVFVEIDGSSIRYTLDDEEEIFVDPGHVAAYTPPIQMDIKMIKGFRNVLFGGEGMFLTKLKGPGDVWLQTMPAQNMARSLIPFLPVTTQNRGISIQNKHDDF